MVINTFTIADEELQDIGSGVYLRYVSNSVTCWLKLPAWHWHRFLPVLDSFIPTPPLCQPHPLLKNLSMLILFVLMSIVVFVFVFNLRMKGFAPRAYSRKVTLWPLLLLSVLLSNHIFSHPSVLSSILPSIQSSTHPSIHPSVLSSIHPYIQSPTYPCIHWPINHSSIHPSIHPTSHPPNHTVIHPSTHPPIHPSMSTIHPTIQSSTHPYSHSPIHPPTHSPIYTIIHPPNHTVIHPSIQSTHPFTHLYHHPPTHPYSHPPIHTIIHPSIQSSTYPYNHPPIHTVIHPSIQSSAHPYSHPPIHTIIHRSIQSSAHPYSHPPIHTVIRPSTVQPLIAGPQVHGQRCGNVPGQVTQCTSSGGHHPWWTDTGRWLYVCVCVVMGVGGTFQGKSLWVQAVDDIAYGELTQVDGCMCVWGVGVGGSGIPRQVSVGTSSGWYCLW